MKYITSFCFPLMVVLFMFVLQAESANALDKPCGSTATLSWSASGDITSCSSTGGPACTFGAPGAGGGSGSRSVSSNCSASLSCTGPGGTNSSGDSVNFAPCGTWDYPTACPTACGNPQTTQTQQCSLGAGNCIGSASSRTCPNTGSCVPNTNCVGSWSNNGTCSVSGACGQSGTIQQTYTITTAQSGTGTSCPSADGATRAGSTVCSTTACPPPTPNDDCIGAWSDNGSCSVSGACGQSGTIQQTYSIIRAKSGTGASCPNSAGDTRWGSTACGTGSCPVGTWIYPTACPSSCGEPQTTQTQVCSGGSCSGSAGTRTCNATASCSTGTWSYPSPCPSSCGEPQTTQTQVCSGGSCSGSAGTRTCNATAACPVDGQCGSTIDSCSVGTRANSQNNATDWTWRCNSPNTGNPDYCAITKPTGTLTANPQSCTIALGQRTCDTLLTWVTNNPYTSYVSQVVADGNAGPDSIARNNHSQTLAVPYSGRTFRLYNYSLPIAATTVNTSCALGGWDSDGAGMCVNPLVDEISVTGEYYGPGRLIFKCNNWSNKWVVYKGAGAGVFHNSGDYTGQVSLNISAGDTYQVACKHGTYEGPRASKLYRAGPPPAPRVSLTTTPRTIVKNGTTVLTWDAQFPDSCRITAKVVCTNDKCNSDQLAYQATLNTLLTSGTTDANDPYGGNRLMSTALTTILPSHKDTDWKALGKKTITQIPYTVDFTYKCSTGNQDIKRLQVAKSKEG